MNISIGEFIGIFLFAVFIIFSVYAYITIIQERGELYEKLSTRPKELKFFRIGLPVFIIVNSFIWVVLTMEAYLT